MNDLFTTATEAARAAGSSILSVADSLDQVQVEQKSLHDYVSEADRNAERIISELVQARFPSHAFLGEEYGGAKALDGDYTWVVDPLDGTTNFLRGIPHYAVSIAVLKQGVPLVGVVYDPIKDELFSAIQGEGAFLNQAPLRVRESASIRGALLATGVPYSGKHLQTLDAFMSTTRHLLGQETSGIRRLGAAALDLAYVAAGRFDGYWEAKLQAWDIAAGGLLVTEAGGVVTDLGGDPDWLATGDVLAASPAVHVDMLAITSALYSRHV